MSTDERLRGGVVFFGLLRMCPRSGSGEWVPYDVDKLSSRLRIGCSHALISILRVMECCRCPHDHRDSQWLKSDTRPENAVCAGCIITPAFAEAVCSCLHIPSFSACSEFRSEFATVLASSQNFLNPESLLFFQRYLTAGNTGAFAPYLLLRRATSEYWVSKVLHALGDPTNCILADRIDSYLRDGSWADPRCAHLRSCLARWFAAGVSPSNENLHEDQVMNKKYSQLNLEGVDDSTFKRLSFVPSSLLKEYYRELHRVVVVVTVGLQNILSPSDRSLPGTVKFHFAHFLRRGRLPTSSRARGGVSISLSRSPQAVERSSISSKASGSGVPSPSRPPPPPRRRGAQLRWVLGFPWAHHYCRGWGGPWEPNRVPLN